MHNVEEDQIQAEKPTSRGVMRILASGMGREKLGETLVRHGYISSFELDLALVQQSKTREPLGRILIRSALISRQQLFMLLACQKTTRIAAATMLCLFSLAGMGKKARAGQIGDLPASLTMDVNHTASGISDMYAHPALFGAEEKFSSNLKAFTKWTSMFDRFNASMHSEPSRKMMDNLRLELAQYKSSSIAQMAKDVNNRMNKVKYILDDKNWGKSDYWATPVEFMSRGGDCEDFAIAKYTALRSLGVPESRLRIAIVHDQKKNIPHAILIVYSEKGPLVLDNQIKETRAADTIAHYKPIFSINRDGWWLHTTPKGNENTVVASAR